MTSRVVVVAIIRKVQTRVVVVAGKGKSKGQGKNRNSHGRAPGQLSNASTSQIQRGLTSRCLHQQDRASSVDLAIMNLVSVQRIMSTEVTWHTL